MPARSPRQICFSGIFPPASFLGVARTRYFDALERRQQPPQSGSKEKKSGQTQTMEARSFCQAQVVPVAAGHGHVKPIRLNGHQAGFSYRLTSKALIESNGVTCPPISKQSSRLTSSWGYGKAHLLLVIPTIFPTQTRNWRGANCERTQCMQPTLRCSLPTRRLGWFGGVGDGALFRA